MVAVRAHLWYTQDMSKMFPRNQQGWYALRFQVLERDGFTCGYCGRAAPEVILHVDHVIAVMDGGSDAPENLITCCAACNLGKSGLRLKAYHRQRVSASHDATGQLKVAASTIRSRLMEILGEDTPTSVRKLSSLLSYKEDSLRNTLRRMKKVGLVNRTLAGWLKIPLLTGTVEHLL